MESNSRNYKATENFGKLSGDRDMQGHRSAGPSEVWLYQVKHAHDSAFQLDYTKVYKIIFSSHVYKVIHIVLS